MNRRAFLGSAGAALSLGVFSSGLLSTSEALEVRVWLSEEAAAYDGLEPRIEEYLGAALGAVHADVRVSFGETALSLPSEDARSVLANRWPRLVVEGAVGLREVDPVHGVNLLVTDGDPTKQPSGFARPHVAAATGAQFLAEMGPATETPETVPYSIEAAATQLLLHECGHALGLDHGDGSARVVDGAIVASPMVSSYLWAPRSIRKRHLKSGRNACGVGFPVSRSGYGRRLELRFADCAVRALDR